MSQHHRKSKHSTHAPKRRREISARLPLQCVNCPHMVTRDHQWQVGHIRDAMFGGSIQDPSNVGPSHTWCPECRKRCNQVAGGRLGAAVTNSRRVVRKAIENGRRSWL